MFISYIYMFWATMHSSSREITVFMTWYLLFCVDDCLVCTAEWNTVTQNMQRKEINILRKTVHQV